MRKMLLLALVFLLMVSLFIFTSSGFGVSKVGNFQDTTLQSDDKMVEETATENSLQGYSSFKSPAVEWNNIWGGAFQDIAHSVQQTGDGGYIAAGSTYSFGAGRSDIWLVKTDANGNMQWNKTYGEANSYEGATSIELTADGGYIIGGGRNIPAEPEWVKYGWLIKTDPNGDMQWSNAYGNDFIRSVQQTSDGGYIVAGSYDWEVTSRDFWLVKTNSTGDVEWSRTYDYNGTDEGAAFSVRQTSDGGYILVGGTYCGYDSDIWLIKTDMNGSIEWNRTYDGGWGDDGAHSVRQTNDGGYVIAGYSERWQAPYTSKDFWLIKTDSVGNVQWDKVWGSGLISEKAYSVEQTSDGGYVIAGTGIDYSNYYDSYSS